MAANPLQPLIDKWYNQPTRGPWMYPQSPYGMGDLVPGNMPTRFGPLMPIPDAGTILSNSTVSPAVAEYFNQSIGQETGRVYDSRPVVESPLPANLDTRPGAGVPINGAYLGRPMPTVLYPRPDASTVPLHEGGLACWVGAHPLLSVGAAVAVYFVLRGKKR